MKLLKAFRPVNLLIILLTVACLRLLIIEPLSHQLTEMLGEYIEPGMSYLETALLVLSMILIAAGGYMVNDVHDTAADEINKPGKNIINSVISSRKAMNIYFVLTALGIGLALYLAVILWTYNLVLLHIAAAVSLYFYAVYFKRTFFPGNFITAFCVACVPLVYGLYEIIPMQMNYLYIQDKHPDFNLNFMAYWIVGFAGFAFLITLAREITKDIQDLAGDQIIKTRSLPQLIGITPSKIIISIIYLGMIALLTHIHLFYLPDHFTLAYFSFLAFCFVVLIALTILAHNPQHFKRVSTLNKIVSVFGVLYSAGVAYIMYSGKFMI